MKLLEHMGKDTFSHYSIPVPLGRVVFTPEEAEAVADNLGGAAVLKAQIPAGGRGKAGGILFSNTAAQAREQAETLFGSEIHGHRVERVLVEERLDIDKELYLAVTVDSSARRPVLILSSRGGVDIESVPDREIFRERVDVRWGLFPYQVRSMLSRMGLAPEWTAKVVDVALALYRLFRREDAVLAEINPLVFSGDRVIAADARITIDDDSRFRHVLLPETEVRDEVEEAIFQLGFSYVALDGEVAILANGAGATMATMDVLQHLGAGAKNFLDVGGGADQERVAEAIRILQRTEPAVLLINVFGGITRCDELAHTLVDLHRAGEITVPWVIRLAGTNEEEGRALLMEEGLTAYGSLKEAAERAAEWVRGGEDHGNLDQ